MWMFELQHTLSLLCESYSSDKTRPPDTPDTVKSIWNYSDSLYLINLDSELWHKNDDVFIHLHLQDQYTNKRLWKGQRYNKWHKCGPSVNICHSFQAGSKHLPKRWSRRVIFGVFEVKMISSVLQIWVKTLHTSKNYTLRSISENNINVNSVAVSPQLFVTFYK